MSNGVLDRRVILGGQTRRRGILSSRRSAVEWAGMAATAVWVVPLLTSGELTWGTLLGAAVLVCVAVGLWTPFPALKHRSVAGWGAWQARFWVRRRRSAVFVPAYSAPTDAGDAARFAVPEPVGVVRVLEGRFTTGEPMALVRHANPGRRHFYTVAFEMRGDSAGMDRDYAFGRAHHEWGRFCATLAQEGSLVRTVQQVTRVVPYDTADHAMWAAQRIPVEVPQVLKDSYVELLDHAAATTEQHRTWLVLRLPVDATFQLRARRLAPGDEGEVRLVEREVAAAAHFATQHGLALRCLDERRLGSVIRALQDADHPIDKVAGMDFERAWLAWDATDRRSVRVDGALGEWHVRTALVPPDGLATGWLSPDFLHPLVSGVSPSVVRTISTVIDLVPVDVASSRAQQDVTLDLSASREAQMRVTDGAELEQLAVSQERLADLRPGTGHHGAAWSMSVTFAARTLDELDQVSRQISATANRAHLTKLAFIDGWQDAGLTCSLPLARGLAVRR